MGKDGEEEEHPKSLIEVMDNTKAAVEGFAQAHRIPETDAALILILNELRCIHWHFDILMAKKEGVENAGKR